MSDTYIYEKGAIHNDNKKVVNISVEGKTDVSQILKSFFSKDVAEAEVVSEEEDFLSKTGKRDVNQIITYKSGRKVENLFLTNNTQDMVDLFVKFLKKHNSFSKLIDTRKNNYINRAFVTFYRIWLDKNMVFLPPNGNACYRFLKDDCGLNMVSEMKTYATFIRNMITNEELDLMDMQLAIESFLIEHKVKWHLA